jgi:hypothetical protein
MIACPNDSPYDAVARLTAVQAQDRPSSAWAIGLRTSNYTVSGIEKAVGSRSIVRTWLMRGTLHFTAAEDVRWILDLVAPKIIAGSKRRDDGLQLDEAVYERSRDVFINALKDRGQLTRSEMMSALEETGISTAGQRGYHILWHLALKKLICFGPMVGKEQSFVLLDDWIPEARSMSREQALGELAERYFTGHGPAAIQDLVWWSGITVSEAREGVEIAGPRLVKETHGGVTYWSGRLGPNAQGPDAHLLPAYDEYIIGYRDRSAVLDDRHTKDVLSSNGVFYPSLVIDGRVCGTWRATKKKGSVSIDLRPFSRLGREERKAVDGAAERYGNFLGQQVTTVGKHI